MKARLYFGNALVAEAEIVPDRRRVTPHPALLRTGSEVTLAVYEEHAGPGARPLFLRGRLEQS